MEFKKQLIEKLNERFEETLFLNNIFTKLANKLEIFKNQLDKYTYAGLEILYSSDDSNAKLTIEDDFISIEYDFDDMLIYIIADDIIREDYEDYEEARVIDKIGSSDDGESIYWKIGIEKAFDYYLKKAFENML
ncbi:hypothetical protein [Heyndrickxia camelliae]|uniref:Uncharacterized protein n=1 Tax=Heyndrickxia camelliae TaxID=1707093 RepID=A0A2N3LDD1_9BACI|nr:hypothetical protein [Heyndrickxia camelliae]PKR82575.1 hypothetical protein CWO92_23620 [Heyndrickxia camelliae]